MDSQIKKNTFLAPPFLYGIFALLAIFFVTASWALWDLWHLNNKLTKSVTIQEIAIYHDMLKSFRSMYASEVVERVRPLGIEASSDYKGNRFGIPLPESMTVRLDLRRNYKPPIIGTILLLSCVAVGSICLALCMAILIGKYHQAILRNQTKGTYLAHMSHEFRTPLNAIIGYSELLIEDAQLSEKPAVISDLEKIHAAGRHLLSVINDVLDFSKVEAGKITFFLETFALADLIRGVADTIQPLVRERANTLEVSVKDPLGAMHADVTKVRQILFNLLSNAAKFTEKGKIELSAKREKVDGCESVVFTVKDTGLGLSAEQQKRIFQPFEQADKTTSKEYGGCGLGLAITKSFCESMGGKVALSSELGKGSTFTVILPANVGTCGEQSIAQVRAPFEETSFLEGKRFFEETSPFEETRSMRDIRADQTILVVDDDPSTTAIVSRYLSKEGYRVVSCSNGAEAVGLAEKLQPSLITLDILMPGMDGWEVLRQIRRNPALEGVQIIIITMLEDRAMAKSLGATDFVNKPVSREALLSVVNKYVGGDIRHHLIVVVGDENYSRELVERTFQKNYLNLVYIHSGKEALEYVQKNRPTMILLDLMMPNMEGFQFLSWLRAAPHCQNIPVLATTRRELQEQEHQRLKGSIIRVLHKDTLTQKQLMNEVVDVARLSISNKKPVPEAKEVAKGGR